MALNNFEKQVQQKLKNREMKPSTNSWDRLDAMLSVEEKPKKKGFFWINIAASFIVLASVGYYFYNQNTIVEPVKEESIIVEENSEFRIQNLENKEDNKKQNETVKEILVKNTILIKENKTSSISKQYLVDNYKANNQQPTTNNQKGVSNINQSTEKIKKEANLVDNLKSTTQNQQPITNTYISAEKLLADVSNVKYEPNNSEKINQKSRKRISVNPNSLLSNAEAELNHSYRESALDKLNKNFNSVKTVLANRNYQE